MRLSSSFLLEEARLNELYSFQILDTQEEKEFNDLVSLVVQITGCASAAINFVDRERVWIKSSNGAGISELPREKSLCRYAILSSEITIVEDLLQDERFFSNHFLTKTLNIRFYAGAPIISDAGHKLGTVCVFDSQLRLLTDAQKDGLRVIASQVKSLLELRAKNHLLQAHAAEQSYAGKKLTHSLLQQQEEQRMALGVALHEDIAQGLAAAKLYLEVMAQSVCHSLLATSLETVSLSLEKVKAITHSLVPTTLQNAGFRHLMQILADRYSKCHALKTVYVYEGEDNVPLDMAKVLYRLAEEAFENIRLHAGATNVSLTVHVNEAVTICITDNGSGLDTAKLKMGPGLGSIVAVTEYFGGTVDLESSNQPGCTLKLCIPLPQDKLASVAMLAEERIVA